MTCLPFHLQQFNPQILIFENSIPTERNKIKHKNPSTHCGPIFFLLVIGNIPEFLKPGLAKIRAHFTSWQLKAIKSVQRPIKKPISDAEQ